MTASKTLKKLTLDHIDENVLNHFTLPFEELQDLTCDLHDVDHTNTPKQWSYLFPKLRRLTLTMYSVKDLSYIDCNLPHLEHLSLGIARITWDKIYMIKSFIRKNQQIKNIELKHFFPPGFAKFIEPWVQNLQNVSLSAYDIGKESICFESVKHFGLNSMEMGSLKNLSLPSLESLEMRYTAREANDWIEFFHRHITHLKHLILGNSYGTIRSTKFIEFTAMLTNLPCQNKVTGSSGCNGANQLLFRERIHYTFHWRPQKATKILLLKSK